jgi:predicted GH43/DUF377 family glycosyl hydrolase
VGVSGGLNPAAFVHDGKVHMLYRALGGDGISRIGYATSDDGVHFTRHDAPAYDPSGEMLRRAADARKRLSYQTLTYNTVTHASGGGWGGSEDPRAVIIDGQVMMTFTSFEGWDNVRIMLSTLGLSDLEQGHFAWSKGIYISTPDQVNKNWVLFPEKIHGKYAILHALTPKISIEYFDSIDSLGERPIVSNNHRSGRPGHWDAFVRGAGAPPIKTKFGWLLLYHGMDPNDGSGVGYRVGAMLLDLNDPTKVLYRSESPILEPMQWYENDWKPGVVYASGAVIFNDDLIVYYGGGDKYIAAAKMNLDEFLHRLMSGSEAQLVPAQV